jgi:hypothetical protein
MDIPFKQVNWRGNPRSPFSITETNAECDSQLRAEANQLLIDEIKLSKIATIDSHEYTFDPASWKCIVVGESKVAQQDSEIAYYVLLVRSVSRILKTYERVGVGVFSCTHFSIESERIFLI